MQNHRTALAYVALVFMALFYSTNLIIGRAVLNQVEPYTLAFFRWLLAALILAPFAFASQPGLIDRLWRVRWTLLFLGFLGMVICGGGVYVGLKMTTATNGTLIYTTSPALIILIEWLVFGRKVSIGQILGVLLAIFGIFAIVLKGSLQQLQALSFNMGDLLIAAAALSWAIYSVILRREKLAELPVVVSFFGIAASAVLLLAPLSALEILRTGAFPAGSTAWLSIVALAIIPSVLAFSAFQFGVKTVGAARAGLFLYLLPPFGVGLAILFLGEKLQGFHLLGMIAILGGIILATLPTPRKRTKAPV